MTGERKAYAVMYRDYGESKLIGVFSDEGAAKAYAQMLSRRHDCSAYEVEESPLKDDVPIEYQIYRGYAFKYLRAEGIPYTHDSTAYLRSETADDLHAEPRPIMRDRLERLGGTKGVPFYAIEVWGASEEAVRQRYDERVVQGEAWLSGWLEADNSSS